MTGGTALSSGPDLRRKSDCAPSHHSFRSMKITDVKVWLVEGVKYNWTLLKVCTDMGPTGVGEATNWPGSPIVEAAARHVGERVVGLDPLRTDFIWTKLYRDLNWIGPGGAALCAMSGLDMALLDLKAKVLGVPLHQLLGGPFRTEIPLYANYWFTGGGHSAEDYARQARQVAAAGFTGLKFDPFAHTNYFYGTALSTDLSLTPAQRRRAVEVTHAVRDAIGPDIDLMLETHAMLNGQMAVRMAEALAPYGLTWYEEPAGPENVANLRALRERLPGSVSICVGERHYTRHGFRPVLEAGICDIIMPDITRCGGPSELKRIATMAEAYNVLIAPHNPNGPLSTLASGHVCATIPNFFRCEFMFNDVPWRDAILTHPLDIREGSLHLSDRPGLGVDLVEEELARHPGVRALDARENYYV
jgi:galactonate dehydratase